MAGGGAPAGPGARGPRAAAAAAPRPRCVGLPSAPRHTPCVARFLYNYSSGFAFAESKIPADG